MSGNNYKKNGGYGGSKGFRGFGGVKADVYWKKGDLRRYNEVTGDGEVISFDLLDSDGGKIRDGEVFSFDLLDSDGGEIRVTRFNAQHSTKILMNATKVIFFNVKSKITWIESWVTEFQEAGEEILGTSEAKIKEETYGDEQRLKVIVVKLVMVAIERSPVNCASLSMLPWPKPTIWPSDASSEVLAKEKLYY
ncbi:hypothetical protein Tco_0134136 [Tanacetum coccineum]